MILRPTVKVYKRFPLFVWLLIVLVPLATLIPYVVLYYQTPPGLEFTGFIFASDDPDSYLANMKIAETGWKFNFMFTSEETEGGYIFLFYIFLGKLALLLNTSLLFMYHLARVVSGMLLILAGWLFLRTLNLSENERKWGFIIFCLAIQFPAFCHHYWGLVVHHPEASPFANILLLPHVTLSQALFLFGLYLFRTFLRSQKLVYIALINIAVLIMVLIHPYMILPFTLIALVSYYFQQHSFSYKKIFMAAASMVACTPYLAYLFLLMSHPDIRQWQIQSSTLFSSPIEPIMFNSILMILGIMGFFLMYRRDGWRNELLWLCTLSFVLIFIPFYFQERLLEAVGPVLSFAGGITISSLETIYQKKKHLVSLIFSFFLIPVIVALLAPTFNPPTRSFMSKAEVSMYKWMDRNLHQSDVVLADLPYGLRIPGRAGCRVWCGHHDQTFKKEDKHRITRNFFTETKFNRKEFLQNTNVKYILLDTKRSSLPPMKCLIPVRRYGHLLLFERSPISKL